MAVTSAAPLPLLRPAQRDRVAEVPVPGRRRPAREDGPVATPSTSLARALVLALAEGGVREVVLCPGSRSAPLAYALHAADAAGLLRLHVRHDERVAAFTALGVGRLSGAPAAVVTTSGTAVANLLPAALEAAEAGLPLLLLTADRPAALRGTWANQTTARQPHLLAAAVRTAAEVGTGEDAGAVAVLRRCLATARGLGGARPGPVHVDVGFDDPLVPDDAWTPLPSTSPASAPAAGAADPAEPVVLEPDPRTLVVAGDGAGEGARALAEAGGWPLLAEPSSGARCGPHAVGAPRLLLGGAAPGLAAGVQRVVAFGRPTLSRPVSALLARGDVELVHVASHPDAPGPPARPGLRRAAPGAVRAAAPGPAAWLTAWTTAGAAAARAVDAVLDDLAAAGELTGPLVAREVAAATRPHELLVAAASNPVRDLDLAGAPWAEHPRAVLANRGLSGIDGTLSTASGAALAAGAPTRVLVGDLALLHDLNGLLLPPGEPEPDLQVVLVDDDGGGIFTGLEHGEPARAATFERLFGTPHGADAAALCAGYGVRYAAVGGLDELRAALAPAPAGRSAVHVRVRRSHLRALHARLAAAAAAAVQEVSASRPGRSADRSPRPPR